MNYEGLGGYGASPYSSGGPAGGEPYVQGYGVQPNDLYTRAEESRKKALQKLNEAEGYQYNGDARRNALLEAQVWATLYAADVEASK